MSAWLDAIRQAIRNHTHNGTDSPRVVYGTLSGTPTEFTPEDHADHHENGGSDEISVTGLSGELADAQTPKAHDMLSAYHGDTTASAVSRGSLITGQGSTPKWVELAIGDSGKVLQSDGTDAAWSYVGTTEIVDEQTAPADSLEMRLDRMFLDRVCYEEETYTSGLLTNHCAYTDSGKGTKLYEVDYTYI